MTPTRNSKRFIVHFWHNTYNLVPEKSRDHQAFKMLCGLKRMDFGNKDRYEFSSKLFTEYFARPKEDNDALYDVCPHCYAEGGKQRLWMTLGSDNPFAE